MIAATLGHLPVGAKATGTTNILLTDNEHRVYSDERRTQVDMRLAKIVRFGRTRTDIGVDLYNLFNSNVTKAYQQTYEQATNGAAWLRPTAIVSPRLARFHVTFDF